MLRVIQSSSSAAAKSYYTASLARGDYYTRDQELAGIWGGLGTERLGLVGTVNESAFAALAENSHPRTGEQLTPRFRADRTVGYDFNFHPPKSVSILHALTGDERIREVFERAVDLTMRELEAEARARVRKSGADSVRVTGNLVWARFVHRTTRPVDGVPDPHLHAHCYVFNATYDAVEGSWKAGQFRELKHDAPYFEAAFLSRLAVGLEELGYGIQRKLKSFEIEGVPQAMVSKFSRRTQQISKIATERGITDPRQKALLGASTRKSKRLDLTASELLEAWRGRLTARELDSVREVRRKAERAPGQDGRVPQHLSQDPVGVRAAEEQAVRYALAHGFERESVMEERRFLELSLRHGVGVVTVEGMKAALLNRAELVQRSVGLRKMLTTQEVLEEERAIIDFVRNGRGTVRPLVIGSAGDRGLPLTAEQRCEVEHLLGSTDRVTGVRGISGAGKTTLM